MSIGEGSVEYAQARLSARYGERADELAWRRIDHVRALDSGDLFCWITGWTSDFTGARLSDALVLSGARALLQFPPFGPKARAPLLLAMRRER